MTDDLEDTIGRFVELEEELTTGAAAAGTYHEGTVSGGTKVAVADVPEEYPLSFDTEHALRLDVDTDDGSTVNVYLPWPERGSESDAVVRLLDRLDIETDEFANIYGERVALEPVDGWHRVDVEATSASADDGWEDAGRTARRTTPPGSTGDAGSSNSSRWGPTLAVGIGVAGWVLAAVPGLGDVGVLALVASVVAIPAALVFDAAAASDDDGWDPNPLLWGLAGFVPFANSAVGFAYVVERRVRARRRGGPAGGWFWVVVGATVLAVLPIAVAATTPEAAFDTSASSSLTWQAVVVTGTWLNAVVLVPLSIYLDARRVEEAGDWDPLKPVWVGFALVATVFLFGWLVGAAYLLRRRQVAG